MENSYRSSDRINGLKWNRLREKEVQSTLRYYQGLLALRKAHPLFRLSDSSEVRERISLLPDVPEEITAFQLTGEQERIIAAFNPTGYSVRLNLSWGNWAVFVEGDRAGREVLRVVSGEIELEGISAFVAILEE